MKLQPEKFRILVVDDTPANIRVLGTLLRQQGYQINIAQNGTQALEIVDQSEPDLILLDVMMPELDGLQTCSRLKQNPATRDIPVIFLTARTDTDDVVRGFDAGAVDYIAKPFNPPELLSRVSTHLELRAAREKLAELPRKLSRYLSPQVYASLFSGRTEARIESSSRDLTVLFSDIAGFTARTESAAPQELTRWLNRYLNDMSAITARFGGTLDKFVGDGVMVFFGDPESRGIEEDAIQCARMAVAMQQQARDLEVALRIGISSGYCTVGNFGSEDRMEYTIIGRVVNTAARLEQHAEPGTILISSATYERIRGTVRCDPRGALKVKGIEKALMTFRIAEP